MDPKGFGKKIKELRHRAGLSQEELAELSGLSLRSIQRIENDQTGPRGDSLKRIAKALNVELEVLTGVPEIKYSSSTISVKKDPKITLFLILSVFGYLLNPVLGVVFPSIIWLLGKNATRNVQEIGLKIIRFELVWCAILVFAYIYLFCKKFFDLDLPVPGNGKSVMILTGH